MNYEKCKKIMSETLTILQAKSTGLEVAEPLPIFPENEPENSANPEELETQTAFTAIEKTIEGSDLPSTLYPKV